MTGWRNAAILLAWAAALPASAHDLFAVWSPDGRQIALTSDRGGDWEIYLAQADGSGLRRLTDHPGRDAHPAFTPDGRDLIFQSPRNGDAVRLFRLPLAGGEPVEMAPTQGFCGVPAVSPDGARIAFMCSPRVQGPGGEGNPWSLFVMDIGGVGVGVVRLTEGAANDQVPVWAPDGRGLVFFSNRSGRDQLHRLDLASGETTQVTDGPEPHRTAAFSPDGRTLWTLRALAAGGHALTVIEAETGQARDVLVTASDFGAPSLSPDGRRVLFPDMADGAARIGVADIDGSNRTLIAFTD